MFYKPLSSKDIGALIFLNPKKFNANEDKEEDRCGSCGRPGKSTVSLKRKVCERNWK
jgi:hypothetical protein